MRLVALAVLILGLGAAPGGDPADDVKKVLSDAEKVKRTRFRLSKESKAKIEKALGEGIGKIPTMYECRASVPLLGMEKSKVYVVFLDVQGPKGKIRIGVAAVPYEKLIAKVAVLSNNKDDKIIESEGFLIQFEDYEYGEAIYNPYATLEAARKKAAGGKDKTLSMLITCNEEMRKVQRMWDQILDKIDAKDKTAAKDLDSIAGLAKGVDKITKKISFYRDTQQQRYDKWMKQMIRDFGKVKGEVNKKDFISARKDAVELYKSYCSRCHASSQRTFSREREKRDIGNGYFDPKLDVYNPDEKHDKLIRAVLKEVRRAVLIMAEVKG